MAKKLSRRDFLRAAGISAVAAAVAACKPQTVIVEREKEKIVTQIVEVEKEVTKIVAGTPVVEKVVETKVVEKVVTPTPVPAEVTLQGKEMPADAAPLAKQIRYNPVGENKHLDVPRNIYDANSVLNWGTEPLLRRNEMMELVPALAESYEVGPDAEYFTFNIRKGAKWDDGEPITAQDFAFTFRHLSDPDLDTPWVWYYYSIKGIKAYKTGEAGPEAVGAEAIDDMTLRIYGEGGAVPHLPALLAYQASCPAPMHRAEADPEHWADDVDGFLSSGPYRLIKWEHNKYMVWEINEYYNGPYKPYIQRLVNPIGISGTGFTEWQNRELDMVHNLSIADLNFVRSDPELNAMLHWYNNYQTDYLALDTMNAPLDNLKVRQALSHAIDRNAMVTVLAGTVQPAYSLLQPGFPAYNPELKPIQAFDPELAKQLLAEAGYPEGKDANGNQLELTLTHYNRDAKVEFIQAQWEEHLGIKVNYEIVEYAQWKKLRADHKMQVYKGPYEYDYLDPANFLTSLFKSTSDNGSPRHAWKNDKYDELCEKAGHIGNDQERYAVYQQAERILVEDVGAIFVSHMLIYQIWWPFFAGIPKDITGRQVYRGLDITFSQVYIRNDVDEWRPKGWLEKANKMFA